MNQRDIDERKYIKNRLLGMLPDPPRLDCGRILTFFFANPMSKVVLIGRQERKRQAIEELVDYIHRNALRGLEHLEFHRDRINVAGQGSEWAILCARSGPDALEGRCFQKTLFVILGEVDPEVYDRLKYYALEDSMIMKA